MRATISPWAVVLALSVVFYTYIYLRKRSQRKVSYFKQISRQDLKQSVGWEIID